MKTGRNFPSSSCHWFLPELQNREIHVSMYSPRRISYPVYFRRFQIFQLRQVNGRQGKPSIVLNRWTICIQEKVRQLIKGFQASRLIDVENTAAMKTHNAGIHKQQYFWWNKIIPVNFRFQHFLTQSVGKWSLHSSANYRQKYLEKSKVLCYEAHCYEVSFKRGLKFNADSDYEDLWKFSCRSWHLRNHLSQRPNLSSGPDEVEFLSSCNWFIMHSSAHAIL